MIKSASEFLELRISNDPACYLRAATEPAAIEIWREVIAERPDMKVWVARNKTVPIEILRQLASDEDPAVRSAVATKNKLPNDLTMYLANDVDESVRERLVYNKSLPSDVIKLLAKDKVERISLAAKNRISAEC
jgi:hypothetical protein